MVGAARLYAVAMGAVLVFACAAGDAWAQSITPPVLRSRVDADYPSQAVRDGQGAATVGLEIVVDETGKVVDALVTAPAGHGFDEAALEAVRKFTFDPARKDGVAIRSTVQLGYAFHAPPPPNPSMPAPAPVPAPETQQGPDQSTLVVAERIDKPPPPPAASDSTTAQPELSLRPRYRSEGVLEAVPGLFTAQALGGGKASQYFMRGFDLDHGTDLAFFVDGAPVNAVSHAHGQGYSDLHFVIPETIAALDSTKGPYDARFGDFATAGTVTFRMADHVDESFATVELGPYGHQRYLALESPDFGEKWRVLAAAEVSHDDGGPFIHPDDYQRFNGYLKATRLLDDRSALSLTLMGYGGTWNSSGALPARAVCGESDGTPTPAAYAGAHCLSRWDSLDPTQGGGAQRFSALARYERRLARATDLEATLYAVRSSLQIFPNDGIAAPFQPDGIMFGSQIEQDDARTVTGGSARITHKWTLGGMPMKTSVGLQVRDDSIDAQLHRTQARTRLDGVDAANIPGPIFDGHIDELELGAYAEQDWRPTRWLRFVLGARADRVDVAVNNLSQTAVNNVSGVAGAGQLSPKAAVVVSPLDWLDLFANYGRGFHSNDARTLSQGSAATLLAKATGAEAGATVRPAEGLSVTGVAFLLDIASELTIDGDTASTSPSGPTRRYGTEVTARYHFRRDIYGDATFTYAHARYVDAPDVAAGTVNLPNAPVRTFSAALGAREPVGPVTLLGSVSVRAIDQRPADPANTLAEPGYVLVNAQAGVRWKRFEVVGDLINIGDVAWRDGQFAVSSRLPSEGSSPPTGVSFTPGLPRTLLVRGTVYW